MNAAEDALSQVVFTRDDEQDSVQDPPLSKSTSKPKTESLDSVGRENKRTVGHVLMQRYQKRLSLTRSKWTDGSERKKRFESKAATNLFSADTEGIFLELKQSEANSKWSVDMATVAKLTVEKTFVDSKTKQEVQLLQF